MRFGLLVPITSRGSTRSELEKRLSTFLTSLRDFACPNWEYALLFGIDPGDPLLDCTADSIDLRALVADSGLLSIVAVVQITTFGPDVTSTAGNICGMWSHLAVQAFLESSCDFALLVGDDVVFLTRFAEAVLRAFEAIALEKQLPFGFGCVAISDESFPGFPSFPVLHRVHLEVFDELLPAVFVNQGGDPFLYQAYRAFGAARMIREARLVNACGGPNEARYEKKHVEWTGTVLETARRRARDWLAARGILPPPLLLLDVIVPTFRAPRQQLEAVLQLPVPPHVSCHFIIIFDQPGDGNNDTVKHSLELKHRYDSAVRIRQNAVNLGASISRNRGLDESAADWVVFLDDDVSPDEGIIAAYADCIAKHPLASGFIGLTRIPAPVSAMHAGIVMSGVLFFWSAAVTFAEDTELPWGVTANLCARRTDVRFDDAYPKTGGGEDIDFCLSTTAHLQRLSPKAVAFLGAPHAVALHPWWGDGYMHFYKWAQGDGQLGDRFGALTYYTFPNLVESLLVLAACSLALVTMGQATTTQMVLVSLAFCAADLLVDVYIQACEERHAALSHLTLLQWSEGVAHCLAVRSYSEAGRLSGHLSRGALCRNLCKRFNWFGQMQQAPRAARTEAWQARRRFCLRLSALMLVLSMA